jgi:hypothetical protein
MLDKDLLTFHILMLVKGRNNDEQGTDASEIEGIAVVIQEQGQQDRNDKAAVKDAEAGVEVLQYGCTHRDDDAKEQEVERFFFEHKFLFEKGGWVNIPQIKDFPALMEDDNNHCPF